MKRNKVHPIKKPKTKKISKAALDKTLDGYYSKYIRLRDSKDGLHCQCVSCGVVKPIKDMQNGHFKKRGQGLGNATKYDERNTHAQCVRCNMILSGNESSYAVALEEKYGFGILQELEKKCKELYKPTVEYFQEKIKYYREKVKELDKYNLWGA